MYSSFSLWYNMASNFETDKRVSAGIRTNIYEGNVSSSGGRPRPTGSKYEIPERSPIRKVYVGNISSRQTNLSDLRECFATFGKVQNAHFAKITTGLKPSYGFVTYFKPEDALTAINMGQSDNIHLHGRRLVVNEADQKYQPQQLPSGKILWTQRKMRSTWSANRGPAVVVIDESKCVLHLLNDDCLRLVFSLLPKRDLIKSERVCKRWQAVCRSMWLSEKALTFSNLDMRRNTLNMHIVNQLLERCGPNLVTVDLSYKPSDLHSSVLSIVAESCPNLACLNISSVPLTVSGLRTLGKKCPELRHVNLEYCFGVKDRDIRRFFFLCKKLESVILSHNNTLTGKCLEGLNKQTIKDLSLNNCSSLHSDVINNCVAAFTNLHSLNIDSCVNLTSKDVGVLFHALPQLKSLSMRQYYPHIAHLTFKTISQLKELVNLNVSQNNSITDEVLKAIAKGCKKIKTLDITGCSVHADHTVGDCGIAAIATLPELTDLKMSYMALASDLALIAIAENATKLQSLECRGVPTFNDFGCSRVVTLCNELKKFDFSGCDEVTSNTIAAAIAAVKLRTNNVPLKLIVGGTCIEADIIETPDLLKVDYENLCAQHLRPDFVDNHYFLSESDDDDDFDDLYDVDFDSSDDTDVDLSDSDSSDSDVVGSPAMFFGDDLGEYYGYLAFMEGRDFNNSDFDSEDDGDDDDDIDID